MLTFLRQRIGSAITENEALAIILRLKEEDLVTQNEASIMGVAILEKSLAIPICTKNVLRASILQEMVTQVFRNNENGKAIGGK